MIKLSQGAEAVLYHDGDIVIKERLQKNYRIPEMDLSLRKFRTRREAKVLEKLKEINFPSPRLREISEKKMSLAMDFIAGKKVKEAIGKNYSFIAQDIGRKIAQLHQQGIIHGDLTTSNMILEKSTKEVYFIDFGLSFFSEKNEDKAVDLFLLDKALESVHYHHYPGIFEEVLKSYSENYPGSEAVIERLQEVKKRGRNKK